jgi:hypothetical protein
MKQGDIIEYGSFKGALVCISNSNHQWIAEMMDPQRGWSKESEAQLRDYEPKYSNTYLFVGETPKLVEMDYQIY